MSMALDDWFFKKVEEEREIRIPRSFLGQDSTKELEKLIKSRDLVRLHYFYSNFSDIIDLDSILNIKEDLDKERKLRKEDIILIENIVKIKGNDWDYLFDIIGNLTHNATLVDEINEFNEIPIGIAITTKLWIFLSFLELMTKLFSEYIKLYVDKKITDKKQKKYFFKSFKSGGHPEMGKLISFLIRLNILDEKKDKNSFFIKNKLIRNKIAHNNIYFDKNENTLYFTNGAEYSLESFEKDFFYLRDFLLELIYQMNHKNNNILDTVQTAFKSIGNCFLKIERSPQLKVAFQNVVFEWEK